MDTTAVGGKCCLGSLCRKSAVFRLACVGTCAWLPNAVNTSSSAANSLLLLICALAQASQTETVKKVIIRLWLPTMIFAFMALLCLAGAEVKLCSRDGYCSTPPSSLRLTLNGNKYPYSKNYDYNTDVFTQTPFYEGTAYSPDSLEYCAGKDCVSVPWCSVNATSSSDITVDLRGFCWASAPDYPSYVLALTVLSALSVAAHLVTFQLLSKRAAPQKAATSVPLLH